MISDLRRPTVRVALGLSILILVALELVSLVLTVRSHARLRERVVEIALRQATAARPQLQALLAAGGAEAWRAAAVEAQRLGLAEEVDAFDASGRLLGSHPSPAPVEPPDDGANREAALREGLRVTGPVPGGPARLFTYAALDSGQGLVVLRLASAAAELVEDLRDRRPLYLGHAATLVVLLLAGVLALYPDRGAAPRGTGSAFEPFEEAMHRLRTRDEQRAREHEAELAHLAAQLRDREALARAGELTAAIAHEVRNGLATILGYARLLEQGADAARTEEAVRAVRGECETLETVIRRFLELCKDDALHAAPVDLLRLLSRVAGREARIHAGARVAVEGEAIEIAADEELLERAFENLVRNAREAAGERGHVEVRAYRLQGAVAVRIADDGPGLPAELKGAPRLFLTTKKGGLGLGLAIAYKMVQLHGGSRVLRDPPGRGAEALVQLPTTLPESGPAATERNADTA